MYILNNLRNSKADDGFIIKISSIVIWLDCIRSDVIRQHWLRTIKRGRVNTNQR